MTNLSLRYLGHSCFKLESDDYTLIIDPYKGVNGFNDIKGKVNGVVSSHDHFDHCYKDELEIIDKECPFNISFIDSFHDDSNGKKRGLNKIIVIEKDSKRIVHLGDLGHLLDKNSVSKLKDIDILLIPIGGVYTINSDNALKIIDDLNPKFIVPMHYKDGEKGLDVLEDIEVFLKKAYAYKDKLKLVKGYNQSIAL